MNNNEHITNVLQSVGSFSGIYHKIFIKVERKIFDVQNAQKNTKY